MTHFGVAATWVPQPGTCTSVPATGDDHVVRLHIGSPGRTKLQSHDETLCDLTRVEWCRI
jgi:hypothetical protein